jgi:hypothetical protein
LRAAADADELVAGADPRERLAVALEQEEVPEVEFSKDVSRISRRLGSDKWR